MTTLWTSGRRWRLATRFYSGQMQHCSAHCDEWGTISDLDLVPTIPLHRWFPREALDRVNLIVSPECVSDPVAQMSGYSAVPHHPVLKSVMSIVAGNLEQANFVVPADRVVHVTGPFAFTSAINAALRISWEEDVLSVMKAEASPMLFFNETVYVLPFGDAKMGRSIHVHLNLWRNSKLKVNWKQLQQMNFVDYVCAKRMKRGRSCLTKHQLALYNRLL
mmetsp:Transcript_51306/g.128866  ORF Transcript_51306/g.128866 Transcript_51306/m.128866 type:complete len:219 (-) Transcript_51306:252-908(-)